MEQVEIWGLDAMTTGVIFAWATEAMEWGVISEKETTGFRFAWGDHKTYTQAVRMIVEPPNEFFQTLTRGLDRAVERYGGKDFALTFGGNEMAGYHTGPGSHLGSLMGARHSHLDNAGYSVDQNILLKKSMPPEELAQSLLAEERWRQLLSSLVVCFFARGIYSPELVSRTLRISGMNISPNDLTRIGEEIHREKYLFKVREGFSFASLRLPRRILEVASPTGAIEEEYLRKALAAVEKDVLGKVSL